MDDGYYIPAKWIKLLLDGKAQGLTQNRSNLPYTINLYTLPDPTSSRNEPLQPLPSWFQHMLWGSKACYSILCTAVDNLDQWDLIAEVDRYHALNAQVDDLHHGLEAMEAELEAKCHT
jgi:hypothetical protein